MSRRQYQTLSSQNKFPACAGHGGDEADTSILDGSEEDIEDPSVKLLQSTQSIGSYGSRISKAVQVGADSDEYHRIIGLGTCGTVFQIPKTDLALKKGGAESSIWTDFCLTNIVHHAIRDVHAILQKSFPYVTLPMAPLCHEFYPTDDNEFWSPSRLQQLPSSHRTKGAAFTVDLIQPLPQATRDALIERYFEDHEVEEAKADPDNQDCLVRIYLGERESFDHGSPDSLRNFPMRLNILGDLEIEVSVLAIEMAIGLAILHWQAQVDGMDVEFVLGGCSGPCDYGQPCVYNDLSASPHQVTAVNLNHREVHLWILDFDKATRIELTAHDVKRKLVPAFLGNDPYYPMPHVDEELWGDFCTAYTKSSDVILRSKRVAKEVRGLPKQFLDEVLRRSTENMKWSAEESIVFAD
ncbi:MAG: hypothetical protein Q9170_000870 [Blastenia crenularia]